MAKLTTEELEDCRDKTNQIVSYYMIRNKNQERGAMSQAAIETEISQQNISKIRGGYRVGRDLYDDVIKAWRRIFGVSRQFEITAAYAEQLLNYDK
jgi:hypothetical protein